MGGHMKILYIEANNLKIIYLLSVDFNGPCWPVEQLQHGDSQKRPSWGF